MHTFRVSAVELSSKSFTPTTLADSLAARTPGACEAGAANLANLVEPRPVKREFLDAATQHAFVDAVALAFAQHFPLILSPDDVWLCLAQGFALHVTQNAEALRGRFVGGEGKPTLEVRRDDFVKGSPDNDWPACLAAFSDAIAGHIGKKRDLVVADFSTTGPIERAASEITLMDAMQHYFVYELSSMCGIPEITLLGTTEDWRSIRRRAEVFTEFDLGFWTKELVPVLDQFVAASSGQVDEAFWQSFYKQPGGSGGPFIGGWIKTLFPYVNLREWDAAEHRIRRVLRRNPFLTRAKNLDPGLKSGDFPAGISVAPFQWKIGAPPVEARFPMELLGGFVGISQAPESLALRPAIGWAVRDAVQAQSGG
ncbi:DUF4419 domain-containing protein [Polyangium sp. 15x6]|uniref:DUF4419 domain-containing protein n=1 Tax=Polyangium sp. 15x6 TaxID=3042687 RepID=UPI00249CF136|nr:DUF4419 domain-containing protein [Polyangium sp. 15x6]MDI3288704.1 DUF4419 domain-containing protein [Polyangium sp. 15x6]